MGKHSSDKGLIFKICKELTWLHSRKTILLFSIVILLLFNNNMPPAIPSTNHAWKCTKLMAVSPRLCFMVVAMFSCGCFLHIISLLHSKSMFQYHSVSSWKNSWSHGQHSAEDRGCDPLTKPSTSNWGLTTGPDTVTAMHVLKIFRVSDSTHDQ